MLNLVSGTIKLYYNCRSSTTGTNTANTTTINLMNCDVDEASNNSDENTEKGSIFESPYLSKNNCKDNVNRKLKKKRSSANIQYEMKRFDGNHNYYLSPSSSEETGKDNDIIKNRKCHSKKINKKLFQMFSNIKERVVFHALILNLFLMSIFIYICFLSNLNFNYLNFPMIKFRMIDNDEKNKPISHFISKKVDDLMRLMIFFITEYNETYQKAKQTEFLKYLSESKYDGKISKLSAETGRSYFNNIQNNNTSYNADNPFISTNTFKEYENFKQLYKYAQFKIGFTGYCKLNTTGNTCISNITDGLDLFSTLFRDLGNSLFKFMETIAENENFKRYLDVGSSFASLYEFIIENAGKYVPAYRKITTQLTHILKFNRSIPQILFYMLILNFIIIFHALVVVLVYVNEDRIFGKSKQKVIENNENAKNTSNNLFIQYLKFLISANNFKKMLMICFSIDSLIIISILIYIGAYVGKLKPIITKELRLIDIGFGEGFGVFIGLAGFNLCNLILSLQ